MAPSILKQFVQTPVGKPLLKAVQPALHFARRAADPDLPNDQQITHLRYGDRTFAFRHRRWHGEDGLTIQQCFTEAQYELPPGPHADAVQRLYETIVAAGRTPLIFDCGANIGASVLWFAARYPKAHIVGVEPAAENFELLSQNTVDLDVDLRQAAVAAEDRQGFLVNKFGGNMGFCVTDDGSGTPISLLSIGTLLHSKPDDRFTPFVLKIDIEGGEKALFEGDTAALDAFPVLLIEPHDWMLPGEGTSKPFFRFHAATGREFLMKQETVASLAFDRLVSARGQ